MKPKKTVYGVGINDADYVTEKKETIGRVNGKQKQKQVWICPFYRTWKGMLERCYSIKFHERSPSYKGCSVSEEWHTFSNFKAWMETQQWEGNQIDKDLLIEGNKIYSSVTCVFVTQMVNSFTTAREAARGEWMIGVNWSKSKKIFRAQCRNPFTKKIGYLGSFACEHQAHQAWLNRKLELAKELAGVQKDERVAKALIERYSNKVK